MVSLFTFKLLEIHVVILMSNLFISGAQDTYKSKWFAYDDFDFMADKNEPGTTRDTLEHVSH